MVHTATLATMTRYGKKIYTVTGESLTAEVLYNYFSNYFEIVIKHNDGKNATVVVWFD